MPVILRLSHPLALVRLIELLTDSEIELPGQNLTQIEAIERAAKIQVQNYLVQLDLTANEKTFRSKTTVHFSALAGAKDTFIDAITAEVHSITLNGNSIDKSAADGSRIALTGLQEQNELVVDADFFFMNTGEGLHRFVDPVDQEVYLYTQFEVPDSRRMFAVFEQPNLKAEFTFEVIASSRWKVISNQALASKEELSAGNARFVFKTTPKISSYITALVAGPYHEVRSELTSSDGRIIPLGVFSRASLAEYLDADYIFEKTRQGFEFFESNFKRAYPFEKYDQLFVPEFNAGAMENAGCVTFTENYVFRSKVSDATRERRVVTILHELAHMWFGDLVTMEWWNDLWLNESFAEYASTLATAEATEWHGAWTTFASLEKSWAYRQDQLPSTHPIVASIKDLEDVLVNFDGITYAKGASVLKQLVAWVGQDKFMAGVAKYFEKHAWGNTQLKDLLAELEAVSGRDLSEWSALWLETAGVNTMKPAIETDGSVIKSFAIMQTAIKEQPTIRPHRMAVGFYNLIDGKVIRTNRIELDADGAQTMVTEAVGLELPDLILLNDDDLAYTKIRLDEKSWKFAIENLGKIDDSLARSLIWGAAWDATRDAETPARDFIQLVLNNIAFETESTTVLTLLRQLLTAAKQYVAPENRDAEVARVADKLLELATLAKPGSDSQFQFVKFFAQFACADRHFDALEKLISQNLQLSGLEIDTDLAWELLTGLVVGGRKTATDIDQMLAKDNTSNGQRAAIAARAAIPTAESKKAIWQQLTTDKSLSNVLVDAGSLAFGRTLDDSLIEPFVAPYFEAVLELWNNNTFKIAEYLIENLYPTGLASNELVALTAAKLQDSQVQQIPALSRILLESKANVERALRAQQKDSEN